MRLLPLSRLLRDETAATAIEYGLVLALIAMGIFTLVEGMGKSVQTTMQTASTAINTANTAA
ncbi:Flp family type IVb pilin [Novosphingobium umbonatum]|uniref:Flp family type IVb pilin n=1 Tax=Novosphingobium umbonatum TaxID=1908524 RepID=UPI001FE8A529|nr:Flp family type IVb pilin [Novosphingobium umbonatum]